MIFHQNIIELAGQNENFRQVLKTGRHSQVVLMSLLPGEDIGNEVHETVDQILIFVEGNGTAEFNRSESDLSDTAPEPVERVDFKAGKNKAPQKHLDKNGFSCTSMEQVVHFFCKTRIQLYQAKRVPQIRITSSITDKVIGIVIND